MKIHTGVTRLLDFVAYMSGQVVHKIRARQVNALVNKVSFHPFLQPIFNTTGSQVVGCEVLLRVKKNGDYISPASYIEYLECSEHMNTITRHLFSEVTDFFLPLDNRFPDAFYFSFNIYAPQLTSPELVGDILSFRKSFGGKACLVLEIVERGTLQLNETTMAVMEHLMMKGIRFAVDDFGAGTASLRYIEHNGFSTIKIDRELTLSSGNTLVYQKVIDAIVMLSSRLGLSVTAEGVENSVQLELLHQAGVNSVQGYYLAKPMMLSDFRKTYLQSW